MWRAALRVARASAQRNTPSVFVGLKRAQPKAPGPDPLRQWSRGIMSMWGHDVTADDLDAVTLYDGAVSEYLSLTGNPVAKCEDAVRRDPGFVMAHALKGLFLVLSTGAGPAHPEVLKCRRRCQKLVEKGHCNHRERVHVAALTSWAEGRVREACAIWEGWLLEQPVDALTVRLLHDSYYFLGDTRQLRDSPGRVLGAWDVAQPGYLKVCGMFAFGAEECGQYGLAEEQGMRALSEDMRDPWALHAVVHVYEMMSRRYEGQRLLRTSRRWWDDANLLFTHLHWHWGLFQLEEGQFEKCVSRYDYWIREDHSGEILHLVDAAAMLWRLELYGNHVYDRWDELVPHVKRYIHDHVTVFNDVHIAMVLIAAGEDALADEHLASLRAYAFDGGSFFSPAHSTSIPTPTDEELPITDPEWGWDPANPRRPSKPAPLYALSAFLGPQGASTASTDPSSLRSSSSTSSSPTSSTPSTATSLATVSEAVRDSLIAPTPRESSVRLHPPNMEHVDEELLILPPNPEFNLHTNENGPSPSATDSSSSSSSLALRTSGGEAVRPVLTCPFSTFPILPLRLPSEPAASAPTESSTTTTTTASASSATTSAATAAASSGAYFSSTPPAPELVSLGGVGGLGMGSHSVVDNRYLSAVVGVPLVEGLIAYRRGDFDTAVNKMLPLRGIWQWIGGSHAQRDVFELTLEAAATQSRQVLLARALLRERLTQRPNNGMALYHLSSVLFAAGEYRKAGQARDRALRQGLGEERVFVRQTMNVGRMTRTDDAWEGR